MFRRVFTWIILLVGLVSFIYITNFFIHTYAQYSEEKDPEKIYQNIINRISTKEYETALELSKDFIEKYPKSSLIPNVYLLIAESFLIQKEYDQAIIVYRDIIKNYPNSSYSASANKFIEIAQKKNNSLDEEILVMDNQPEHDYAVSRQFYIEKKYDKSIQGFEYFIRNYPNHYLTASAQFLIAESYFKKAEFRISADEYKKVVDLYPKSEYVYPAKKQIAEIEKMSGILLNSQPEDEYRIARELYKKGKFDNAISNFKKFIRIYPDHTLASNSRYWIGESYYSKDDLDVAKAEFELVKKDYPNSEKVKDANKKLELIEEKLKDKESSIVENEYKKIRRFYLLQEYDKAIESFEYFLKKHPDSEFAINALYWIGESYYAKENYKKAIQEFQKIIDNYPNQEKTTHAKLKIAMSNKKLGLENRSEEEQVYRESLKKYREKNFAEAISAFDDFLIKFPKHPLTMNALYWKGESYYALEDYNTAIKNFNKVIEKYPRTEKAEHSRKKIDLAMINMGLGLERQDELEFNDIMDDFNLTNYDATIFSLKKFLDKYPNSPLSAEAQFIIGESYFNIRSFESAMWEYNRVVENYSDSKFSPEAQYKIALCTEELNRPIQTRIEYFNLIEKYPNSEFSDIALQKVGE